MKKLFLVVILFLTTTMIFSIKLNATSTNSIYTLDENKVYNIKNKLTGQYFDIRGWSNSNSSVIQQYTWHGGKNQQFMFKSVATNLYEIIPLLDNSKRVDVKFGQQSSGAPITIYDENSTNAQRFLILPVTSYGMYKIMTETTFYRKAITVENSSTTRGTPLIQDDYLNTNDASHWIFEESTFTAKPFNQYDTTIPQNGVSRYELRFNVNSASDLVSYVIETTGNLDSKITLYKRRTNSFFTSDWIMADDDSGVGYNAKITFKPYSLYDYRIEVSAYSTNSGSTKIKFYPSNEVYFYLYRHNSMDTTPSNRVNNIFKANDYYLTNIVNANSLNELGFNGRNKVNNKYSTFITHGASNGNVLLNPHTFINPHDFPDLSYVDTIVFAICDGGFKGNAAYVAVNEKNAKTAIGWNGSIYLDTAHQFIEEFWKQIFNNLTSLEAAILARAHVININFVSSGNSNIRVDDMIRDFIFYEKGNSISYPYISSKVSEGLEKIVNNDYYKTLNELTETQFNEYLKSNNYEAFNYNHNETRYIKMVEGFSTNEFLIKSADNKFYKSKTTVDKNFLKNLDITKISKSDNLNTYRNTSKTESQGKFLYDLDGKTFFVEKIILNSNTLDQKVILINLENGKELNIGGLTK